jgi:ABC-2 type transport system permease protein
MFRDSRTRNLAYAYLFAVIAFIQPFAYRHSYKTLTERLQFARSFGDNKAIRLFYGVPHDLLTVGGYSAWRVGGTLAVLAGLFGLLAAIRAMRAEEEAGRAELVLAGAVTRASSFVAALSATAGGAVVLGVATFAGLLAGGLPAGGSAFLALATLSVIPVFAGLGALASQVTSTRRGALGLSGAVLALAFLLRVIADTSTGVSWLRWATPLGWAEELRPFAGQRPLVLLLPAGASIALLIVARRIALRRDIGTGLLPARDRRAPRLRLLSSPTQFALRDETGSLAGWLLGAGAFAFVLGVISRAISSAGVPKSLDQQLQKLGVGSIITPKGYLSFTFIFFVLAVSVFGCTQLAAARREESEGRLETMLALPISRPRWLGGRLALAAIAATALALLAGTLTWAGAASQGVSVSLPQMLAAGANCLPVAMLFTAIAALAYALHPRGGIGIAYGLVAVAFVWQLFGGVLGAPRWLLDASPFEHVALMPAQAFRAGAAIVLLCIAVVAALAAVAIFRRRDLSLV